MNSIFFLFTFLLGTTTIQCVLDSSLFTGCGITKTCLSSIPGSCGTACTPATCKVLFSIENLPAEEKLLIELHSDGNYVYMALGFSQDRFMPNADVVGCQKSDASTAYVKDTFNVVGSRNNVNDGNHSALESLDTSINGSTFSCIFTRTYAPQDPSKGFSLNTSSYYLFTATQADNVFKTQSQPFHRHTINPCVSDVKIDPLSLSNVTSSNPDYTLVRTHGLLMLLAWLVFISTGVFIANYTKCSLPNGEWFHLHKYINISAVIIALVGVAIIFISLREWKVGSNFLWAHQLIGLGSILLMLTNPILAAFRCRPTANYRWIFRLIHSVVGYSAIVLASVAICLGLVVYYQLLGKSFPAYYGFWIYVGRLATEWAFHIPLIIYFIYKGWRANTDDTEKIDDTDKKLPKVNPIKLFLHNIFAPPQCPTGEDRKKPSKDWPIITAVLIAFVIFNICFYVAIAVVVALAEQI